MLKKLISVLLCLSALTCGAQSAYDHSKLQMEELGRGVVAIRENPSKVFVSWRYLSSDPRGIKFDVYRNGVKLNDKSISDVTWFVDSAPLSSDAVYTVKPSSSKAPEGSWKLKAASTKDYIPIPLNAPADQIMPDGKIATYSPGDCSIGDADGDGEYEIFLKWDPSNAHDNAHTGYTGSVFIDCLKLSGERLWRIDLGRNIRAGAHYTQFLVYDFDSDGIAELICKTADGTVDGLGKVIGDASKDYRSSEGRLQGRIMDGPEYLTIFSGKTGAALKTVDYLPGRGENGSWGDNYGNRSERHLAAVAYLDGSRPSAVMCRGYYTRATLAAWDWDGKDLTLKWFFDSHSSPELKAYDGQGNHNLRSIDVDGDGCDEIIYGSCCIDHNGQGLYSTGWGHGDAMHVGAMIPGSDKLQVWIGHENKGVGSTLFDARTGELIYRIPSNIDVGRSMAADIDPTNPGWEMWTTASGGIRDFRGKVLSEKSGASVNFAAWWDGDLTRELLNSNVIEKYNPESGKVEVLRRFEGAKSINGSKATPCISGDILGDWREEVLLCSSDGKELRLYVSTIPTDYRFHTFLEDPAYRTSLANENICYNQPPETSFYFGEDMGGTVRGTKLPAKKIQKQDVLMDVLLDSVLIQKGPAQPRPQAPQRPGEGGPNGTPNWNPAQGQRPPQQGGQPRVQAPRFQESQPTEGIPQAMIQDDSYKDHTPDSLDLAKTARPVAGSSRKGSNPVLFLVGDSTMRTGTRGNGDNGQLGWGNFAHMFFDPEKITVENHALGGLSCRTFYRDWWPDVLKGIQKGDYVILELGHNDSGPYDTPTGRSSIPGTGKQSVEVTLNDGRKETVLSYGEYLRRFIDEIRAKGAEPLLFTLTPRNQREEDGSIRRKKDTFNPWIYEIAKEKNVCVIDLESISAAKFEKYSSRKTDYMFYRDNIHTSAFGARLNARSAAEGIAACEGSELRKYLLPLEESVQEFKRVEGRPVLFTVGDSTMENKDSDPDDMWGWGSVLETVFDTTRITTVNAGKAGRSARTFLDEGRWEKVYNAIRPGDFVAIQFGHNDFGQITKRPYRAELAGIGDESMTFFMPNLHEYKVVYTYGWYLRKFVDEVLEKGGIPILLSVTPRNIWKDGKIERRNDTYVQWVKEVASQMGCAFVDVHNLSADFFDSIGQEQTAAYYKKDHTHTSRSGAERNAASFAEGLKAISHPLADYLKK